MKNLPLHLSLCPRALSLIRKLGSIYQSITQLGPRLSTHPFVFTGKRLPLRGSVVLLLLMFTLGPVVAQGALQGNWRINGNGYLGALVLTQGRSGSLFGSIFNEPVRGFYAEAEGVFVLVRGASYSAPTQAFVGRYSKPFAKGRISRPATLSGTFYALDANGGATPQNNQFPFTAVPATQPYPALTLLPAPQSSETCLQSNYSLVNRPAEYGNTWTVPLQFNTRAGSNCPTGEFTGLLSGDTIRGYYAPGSGIVVFVRTMSGVGFMPNQLFVGQARSDYELVANRIIDGRFYALDSWGGASSQRLSYDWRAD